MKPEVSIVIPNYNGKELLGKNLPSVLEAAKIYGKTKEIIVVDDCSSDGSASFLKENFPEVTVVEFFENRGFASAINEGVKKSNGDVVVLLNSDVQVENTFLGPLVKHFVDKRVFSVTPKVFQPSNNLIDEGLTSFRLEDGYFRICIGTFGVQSIKQVCTVAYAGGGFSAFDREKFLELKGFDDLYHPFYWEDVDICYRAWKKGWFALYEPDSLIYHQSHGTVKKRYSEYFLTCISLRNMFLFTWKNITDGEILIAHIEAINKTLKESRNTVLKDAIYEASKKIIEALKKRKEHHTNSVWMDKEIIRISSNNLYPEEVDRIIEKEK